MSEYPEDLKSKVYLMRHFEAYMLDRLFGEHEYTWDDLDRTTDMAFVQKYLRMKHVIVFKLSHDVIQVYTLHSLVPLRSNSLLFFVCFQFNFYDHTKVILSSSGLHITYIDKHHIRTSYALSTIMEESVNPTPDLPEDQRRIHGKLVSKLQYCKDVLQSIITHNRSKATAPGEDDVKEAPATRA